MEEMNNRENNHHEDEEEDEEEEVVEHHSDDGASVNNSRIEKRKKKTSSSIRSEAQNYSKKLAKRGVVYLSRIPPFMKPNKVRYELEQHGEITRLYLQEEDAAVRKRRKLSGGNGSKQFVEGWIEFADKKVAKQVADSLNNTPMGGKKRNFYHDDLWNLKYLKNFKWDMLTEKFAYERRVRESKLRAAMQQAKQQNAEFVEMVEKEKIIKHIEDKKKRKRSEDQERDHSTSLLPPSQQQSSASTGVEENSKFTKAKRNFKQIQSINELVKEKSRVSQSLVKSVFSKK